MIKFYYQIEVRNPQGRVTYRSRQRRCRSWLEQMAHILRLNILQPNTLEAVVDTGSISRNLAANSAVASSSFLSGSNVRGADGETDSGINVGTGSTAVNATQRALVTPITHGAGAGQLNYSTEIIEVVAVANPNSDFRLIRGFTNNSGASITVNEIGLIASYNDNAGATRFFQLARDVLSPGASVPNLSTLTVTYTVRVVA